VVLCGCHSGSLLGSYHALASTLGLYCCRSPALHLLLLDVSVYCCTIPRYAAAVHGLFLVYGFGAVPVCQRTAASALHFNACTSLVGTAVPATAIRPAPPLRYRWLPSLVLQHRVHNGHVSGLTPRIPRTPSAPRFNDGRFCLATFLEGANGCPRLYVVERCFYCTLPLLLPLLAAFYAYPPLYALRWHCTRCAGACCSLALHQQLNPIRSSA